MILTDIVLVAALGAFVLVWWARGLPGRPANLLASALVALGAGVAGVLDDRWQAAVGVCVAGVLLLTLGVNRLRKADRRDGIPFVSGPVFTLLGALAFAAIVMFPVTALPEPSGEHAVGVRSFEVTDESRMGVLHAGEDEPRRLLARVWYPAGDVAGLKRRPYFSQLESETTARGMGSALGFPQFFTYVKHVDTNSFEDAPLMAGASGLPVIFYSHGYTSFLGQNTVLFEELASHGYVVFSVQHTFDSAATVYPNGDVDPMDPEMIAMAQSAEAQAGPTPAMKNALAGRTLDERIAGHLDTRVDSIAKDDRTVVHSARIWVEDRLFLHDELERAAPEAVKDIVAASDLSRVGEMGMSFGGATSGTLCMIDPRCAAGINLDGGDFHFTSFNADQPVPFMMFHSDMSNMYAIMETEPEGAPRGFNEFSYERIATAGSRDDIYRMQLKGAQHMGFSDFSLFMRSPLRDPLLGSTPTKVMIGAQNDFVRGFFDKHLRGVASGFPETERAAYADWILPADNADLRDWWAAKTDAERADLEGRIEAAGGGFATPPAQLAVPAAEPAVLETP